MNASALSRNPLTVTIMRFLSTEAETTGFVSHCLGCQALQ